jgi:two-component system, LuxR family, sensor histidine kinase DctS
VLALRLSWRQVLSRRNLLWSSLVALVAALLVTLVWLAGRYEVSQVQEKIERDASEAVSDIRAALTRNVQSLQALRSSAGDTNTAAWSREADALLRQRREMVRVEWHGLAFEVLQTAHSPYRDPLPPQSTARTVSLACQQATRLSGPAFSTSYFVPQSAGLGQEVMEMCVPLAYAGKPAGYVVAVYSLQSMLSELVAKQISRGQEMSFTEPDGTRLAMHGTARRGGRVFSAQQLVDFPGNTMVLRLDNWRGEPDVFPNVLTALVTVMSIALVCVVVMLGRDMARRMRAERELAEALAFRKAMEDSLVTGLRARDMDGRITYVNPAFCQMTGFDMAQLVGAIAPMPYWPPELIDEYQQRQAVRFAGNAPPREGFESVYLRKDGTRIPVLIIESPLIDAVGKQTGWMGAVLDVSDQRRMEELTRASQDRLQATARLATVGEMASLLSHELNQPLAAISSYATGSINMLQNNPSVDNRDLTTAMQRISEQAERAGKVIKSVHDFVRRSNREREAVAPQALLDAVMPLVGLQARKLGVRVVIDCATNLPPVQCDRTMVEQVLLNLTRNAMQAMEHIAMAQRVLILKVSMAFGQNHASELSKRWVGFSVSDCGAGIDAQTAEQLFTPFFTTKAEGMGLGLSLCRTVIEQHGGALDFKPRLPQGTVFTFTLPSLAGV